MGLGSRKASRHETAASERTAGVRSEDYWAFQPGASVMTVDGILGTVTAVQDGPTPGNEAYEVTLSKGMGGGLYTSSQLSPAASTTASTEKTAAEDYPELGTILNERPDPAINTVLASRTASSGFSCWCGKPATYAQENDPDVSPSTVLTHKRTGQPLAPVCDEHAEGWRGVHPIDEAHHDPNQWWAQQDDDGYAPESHEASKTATVGPPPFSRTAEVDDEDEGCEYCGGDHKTDDHEDEPDEEDAYVSREGRKSDANGSPLPYTAQHGGKHLGDYATEGLAHHAIEHESQKSGFYPNVWTDEGRGMRQSHGDYAHEHVKYFKDGPTSPGVEFNPHPDEHPPIDEYSSREDVEKHLMDHHGVSRSDLMQPGESSDSWRHHLIDQVGGAPARERRQPKPEDLPMLLGAHDRQHEAERCTEPGCAYTSAGHEHHERDLGGLEDSVNHAFGDDTKQMWGDHLLSGNEIGPTKYSSKTASVWWGGDEGRGVEDRSCMECGSPTHHTGQHPFPEKENDHFAEVGDGIFCRNCSDSGKIGHDHEPISFKELRMKLPHGTDCDHCGKEIVPERPHTEDECEYGDECSSLHPEYGEGHISRDDPRVGKWGDAADKMDVLGEQEDHKRRIDEYDNARKQIEPLGDPRELDLLKDNPTGPSKYSSLDPYSLIREAANDSDFRFEVTASWSDVRNKAKRIRTEGGVRIVASSSQGIQAEVKGDHHIYETGLQYMAGSRKVAIWQCGCKWAAYAWGRSPRYKRFEGRMCSHALAVQFEAASRGMFGKEISQGDGLLPGQKKRTPVVIQFDKADDKNLTRRTVPPGNMRTVWSKIIEPAPIITTVAHLASVGDDPDEIGLLLESSLIASASLVRFAKAAAVNNAWGEPAPPQQTWPTLPGATQQKDPNENPASAGFAAGPDPIGWQTISPLTMGDRVASHYSEEAEDGDSDVCSNCGESIKRTTIDPNVPWIHHHSGNAKCDVSSPADAVTLQGVDTDLARPTMHQPEEDDSWLHESSLDDGTATWDSSDQNEYGVQADLHDEPEAALPSTDGSSDGLLGDQSDQMHAVYDDALSPEDSSIQTVGAASEDDPGIAAIIAEFQRTAGAAVIMAGGESRGEAGPSDMDIAAAARAHLAGKTAMRAFSPSEQAQLINESGRARNTDMLDIGDTHYARLDELRPEDDDEDWMG